MTRFQRHMLDERGVFEHEPPPYSWDYLRVWKGGPRDLAWVTCPHGHTTRLTTERHVVDHSGCVSPSYVCTRKGCGFHDYIQLVGWDSYERHAL